MANILLIILIVVVILYIINSYNNISVESFVSHDALTSQKDLIDSIKLFKKFVQILEEENIEYFAIFGTLLGAVRDKGMITTDDDSDILILDKNIPRLLELENKLKNEHIGLTNWFGGYKVFSLDGKKIEKQHFLYPFVDIFIGIINPEDSNEIIYHNKKTRSYWNDKYRLDEVYPLRRYEYEDFLIWSMHNPIPLLDKSYKNWKKIGVKTYDHVTHQRMKKIEFPIVYDRNKKPYIWQYWEGPLPDYIKLCFETVDKNCSNNFNIVRLNENTVNDYIPELKDYDFCKLKKIAHKVDLYRIMLLLKYGGIYIDADTIIRKDLYQIIEKLKAYDFVGFGCTSTICTSYIGYPSNWVIASRPHTLFMSNVLRKQLQTLKEKNYDIDYHDIGKSVLWEELIKLQNDGYQYYHFNPLVYDGSRDMYGYWITTDLVFSNVPIDYLDESSLLINAFYNSSIPPDVKNMTREELLSQDWNFTKFIKKALNI